MLLLHADRSWLGGSLVLARASFSYVDLARDADRLGFSDGIAKSLQFFIGQIALPWLLIEWLNANGRVLCALGEFLSLKPNA
jgi:hypothetical protein